MTHPTPESDIPEEEAVEDATKPSLGGEKLSAETHAALNAAKEQEAAEAAANTPEKLVEEDKLLDEEDFTSMQEAIAAALAKGNESEATPEETTPQAAANNEEVEKLKDQLLRSVAETENIRKRSERELADARKYAVTGFARDMVNVVENLQLALQNIPQEDREADGKLATLAEGVEMTYNELLRVFQSNNIVRIDPKGEKFNHNHHQAVAQVEDSDAEPGTVIQVLQAGYIIHDRLLRPAMVTVSKAAPQQSESVDTEA
jgi:molecular chaperone GrpE